MVLSMALALSACGETEQTQVQTYAMGTTITITAYGRNTESGISAAQSIITSLANDSDPDISSSTCYKINHAEGQAVSVSGMMADMITTAIDVSEKSGDALDLTTYPLVELWGFTNGKYYTPSDIEISEKMLNFCMDQINFSKYPMSGAYSIQLPAYGQISFEAVAKGCASKYAVEAMGKAGIESGIVSMAGNVQTLGLKPDGSNWTIGITDPHNTGSYLATVSVGETAVVTSGTYQKTMPNNPAYHSIINPASGYPTSNGLVSVTIVCEDGTLADCLSTAMLVLGRTKATKYWQTYGGFDMIMITDTNDIYITKGLIDSFDLKNTNYTLQNPIE